MAESIIQILNSKDKPKFSDIYEEFHYRFTFGEQYVSIQPIIGGKPDIQEITKSYFWEQRECYNQVLPLVTHCITRCPQATMADIFGKSGLVSLLVPFQRAYNALKNRKMELINRNTLGILLVEDGSVDTETLEEEGLSPGKLLLYRQGATAPKLLADSETLKVIANEEDEILKQMKLLTESRITLLEYTTQAGTFNLRNNIQR